MKAGKYLAETWASVAESDLREERKQEEARAKERREKELKKLHEQFIREGEEREMRLLNPHCTWLFNHFDIDKEYVFYKTLY